MPINAYLDTEYLPDVHDLTGTVSWALHDNTGRDYYAVNADMNYALVRDHPWLSVNVWPHLPTIDGRYLDLSHPDVRDPDRISEEVITWFDDAPEDHRTELFVWHGARDAVNLRQLLPEDWKKTPRVPKTPTELRTLRVLAGRPDLPPHSKDWHHPLADCHWARRLHEHITRHLPNRYLRADVCLVPDCGNTDIPAAGGFERVGIGAICNRHGRANRLLSHWPSMVTIPGLPHHIDCACGWYYSTPTWSGDATAAWAAHAIERTS